MRYELEVLTYYGRQPRTLKIAGSVLAVAAVVGALSSNYQILTGQLEHRYLESQGRSPEQVAAKAAEEKRLAEEQQRQATIAAQRKAEAERQEQREREKQAAEAQRAQEQQRQAQQQQQTQADNYQQYLTATQRYRADSAPYHDKKLLQNIAIFQGDQSMQCAIATGIEIPASPSKKHQAIRPAKTPAGLMAYKRRSTTYMPVSPTLR